MHSIATGAIERHGLILRETDAAPDGASTLFMFETIVTDVQWSALNIGSLTILVNACSATTADWTMWPWRHALTFDARSMKLALRYSSDMGLSPAAIAQTDFVYRRLEDLSARSIPLFRCLDLSGPGARRALAELASEWRTLSGDTISMLRILEPFVRQRLIRHYAHNCQILQQFLDEGFKSKSDRVNIWGEIELPILAQKRRQARLPTKTSCKLRVGAQIVPVTLVDLSQSGAGITCRMALQVGQEVKLEFADGKSVDARVAWRTEERCGLAFDKQLSLAAVVGGEIRGA